MVVQRLRVCLRSASSSPLKIHPAASLALVAAGVGRARRISRFACVFTHRPASKSTSLPPERFCNGLPSDDFRQRLLSATCQIFWPTSTGTCTTGWVYSAAVLRRLPTTNGGGRSAVIGADMQRVRCIACLSTSRRESLGLKSLLAGSCDPCRRVKPTRSGAHLAARTSLGLVFTLGGV